MNSPAMAIIDTKTGKVCITSYHCVSKKFDAFLYQDDKLMIGTQYFKKDFLNDQERFDNISEYFIQAMKALEVQPEDKFVIEGYAMGATGRVFNIAENTGIMKHKIYKTFKKDCLLAPPMSVKKFATGKGNAKKDKMSEAFTERFGITLYNLLGCKIDGSPSSDIIDAYFIAKYGQEELCN